MEDWIYIQVILPLRLPWEPFYKTTEKDITPGMRVCVFFAGRRYTAVVSSVNINPKVDSGRILEIYGVEYHLDKIGEKEILLWRFMSEYYLCTIGEVYRLAYPAFKTAGEKATARLNERRATSAALKIEQYEKRLDRLRGRLAAKEAGLERKHGEKVRKELEKAVLQIKGEILDITGRVENLRRGSIRAYTSGRECRITAAIPGNETFSSVEAAFAEGKNVLLEGGPSRTGTMVSAAAATIAQGKDVLLLVPEIGLSRNLQPVLEEYFGDSVMVFHSEESAAARREAAAALRHESGPHFVLGTKSALFLPFRNLGLVIVDEEHDQSYKQDSAPRFIARDTAVMLGEIHGADVMLCSPTPSLESLYNCISGRYVHILADRNDGEVEIVDTSLEKRKGGMLGQWSRILLRRIMECREGNILVLRPWGPFDDLKEEYEAIQPGTEATEHIVYRTVHEARRLKLDSFSLVAIIGTDAMLDRQDFRADEKVMQMLEHFRAGFSGRMLVQTGQAAHPVFSRNPEYRKQLLVERKSFSYPPYTRMVDIVITDGNEARMKKLSGILADCLEAFSPIGPFTPVRGKEPEQGKSVIRIMLSKDKALKENKKNIAGIVGDFEKRFNYNGHISTDVDPV